MDITDPAELALHNKDFGLLSNAAHYGANAKELIDKALDFWSNE
ncbi:hypothetical protein [Streptomyces sp. NBC_00576]|nr:hypothetical protein [Streptomyces sp. NBC_00576]WUB74101.1 hypothetical protein OG734_30780 [Streptomyces sp. NBC_00576]